MKNLIDKFKLFNKVLKGNEKDVDEILDTLSEQLISNTLKETCYRVYEPYASIKARIGCLVNKEFEEENGFDVKKAMFLKSEYKKSNKKYKSKRRVVKTALKVKSLVSKSTCKKVTEDFNDVKVSKEIYESECVNNVLETLEKVREEKVNSTSKILEIVKAQLEVIKGKKDKNLYYLSIAGQIIEKTNNWGKGSVISFPNYSNAVNDLYLVSEALS